MRIQDIGSGDQLQNDNPTIWEQGLQDQQKAFLPSNAPVLSVQ